MAVDLFSEASPRYSFSSDINLPSLAPTRSDLNPLDTGIDFEFGISDQESSSADELFSQGILLPIQIREKGVLTNKQQPAPATVDQQEAAPITQPATDDQQEVAPITQVKDDTIAKEAELSTFLEAEEKDQSKATSFWSFKRSSSLNHDPAQGNKKGLLCSLQEGLSRSNSTGSVPNPKKSMQQNKDKQVLNSSKQHPPPLPKSSSTSSSSTSSSYYQYHQKPKNYYGGNTYSPGGGGSRTNSVLNVPPPYISNTNLFGLGSLFRNGKEKKPKK